MNGQVNFSGALNGNAGVDKLQEHEVAAARNVDFGLVEGAAARRRGSKNFLAPGAGDIHSFHKHTHSPYLLDRSYYIGVGLGSATEVHRYNGTSWSALSTGVGLENIPFTHYNNQVYYSVGGRDYYRDDGTNVREWIRQAPAAAVAVSLSTVAPVNVVGTYTVAEGTLVAGTDTATASTTGSTYRITFEATPISTNLNTNTAGEIGDYGIHYVSLMCDNPGAITRISRDYSIGDTSFTDYWHTEIDTETVEEAVPDATELLDSQVPTNSAGEPITADTRAEIIENLRTSTRVIRTRISAAANTFNTWAVPRTKFELIAKDGSQSGWTNIQKVRIIIEATAPVQVVVKDWQIQGGATYPLNDAEVGYVWWETFAEVDSDGNVVAESAPSPVTARYPCVGARATITSTNTATGSLHGFTHRILYSQGGHMRDGYAVATATYTGATATYTHDTPDVEIVLDGKRLQRNLYSRANAPGNFIVLSEPYFDRLFGFERNFMYWSLPGMPDSFPRTSEATISHSGDEVMSAHVANGVLVIVNRDTVYEAIGDVWEGAEANYRIYRTGCTRGSKARRATIKTPYGILLLDYDGIYLYHPGMQQEELLGWVMDKIGDAWAGATSNDPVARKGRRIPAINKEHLRESFAVWADGRVYLWVPVDLEGTGDVIKTYCYVLDFKSKRVWTYQYPQDMHAAIWDFDDNKILVANNLSGTNAKITQIETGKTDVVYIGTASSVQAPTAIITTKEWSWPDTARLTNFNIEYTGTMTVTATVDQTAGTFGTFTSSNKQNILPSYTGTQANTLQITFASGTGSNETDFILYGYRWDAYPEPPKELYHRTEYFDPPGEVEFKTAEATLDCFAGTVTGVYYVDAIPVMTKTYTNTATGSSTVVGTGPQGHTHAYPTVTYGQSAFAEFRSSTAFRFYRLNYATTPEPSRVGNYRTEIDWAGGEHEWVAFAVDMDALGGTALATVYIDGTVHSTHTITGSAKQGYVFALAASPRPPYQHPFGRSAYVEYNSTSLFKHYRTWFERRPEPSELLSFRSPTSFAPEEQEWRMWTSDYDMFGGTGTATIYIENTPVATYTLTGSGMQSAVWAISTGGQYPHPYGRVGYVQYNSTTPFKVYDTKFVTTPEPPRVTTVRTEDFVAAASVTPKTLVANMNLLGGTATAVVYREDIAITTATLTGSDRQTYNVPLDFSAGTTPNLDASKLHVVYTASSVFKHYDSKFEVEPKPYLKNAWYVTYQKIGGASQLDHARYFSLDLEGPMLTTATCIWDVDGQVVGTQTLQITSNNNRQWFDRLNAPAEMRGYLYRLRIVASAPVRVWASSIDTMRVGAKGVTRWFRIPGEIGNA